MTSIFFGFKSPETIPKICAVLDRTRFDATFRRSAHAELPNPQKFDCVVPLNHHEYEPLSEWQAEGASNFLIPGDASSVATADDKYVFTDFLVSNGFGNFVPAIFGDDVCYPFIYKKRVDCSGRHSFIISSPVELEELESRIDARKYFRQEYATGRTEYTTHILVFEGHIRFASTFVFHFNFDLFVKGRRFQPISKRRMESPFLDIFESILNALDFSCGTCCFNYKIVEGVPKIFELNPRFGGSLAGDINSYLSAYLDVLAERRKSLLSPSMSTAQSPLQMHQL